MSEPPAQRISNEPPWMTLVSAGVFLYAGFVLALTPFDSAPTPYKWSVHGFTWMARIVGVGLALVFLLAMARRSIAILDTALAAIAAIGCLLCGAVWLAYGDMQGILLLLFGMVNGSSFLGRKPLP